jgi:hypothetical protein
MGRETALTGIYTNFFYLSFKRHLPVKGTKSVYLFEQSWSGFHAKSCSDAGITGCFCAGMCFEFYSIVFHWILDFIIRAGFLSGPFFIYESSLIEPNSE